MIALFAALQLEVQRFLRRLEVRDRPRVDGFPLTLGELSGKLLLVCRTGIGQRAGEAAGAVLARYRPEAVLSVGLAGALSPEYAVGDLIFGERVCQAEPESEEDRAAEPVLSDGRLLEAAWGVAHACGLSSWVGASLTTSRLVAEPNEKVRLRQTTGLDVVEMESYWVGRAALKRGLPFLAVRVVSDDAEDALPDIAGVITPEGEQRGRYALAYALRHPARIPLLLRTARAEMKAVANLTRFLEAFVSAIEPSPLGKPVARYSI